MSKWEVKHEKKEIFEVRFEAANLVHDVFEGIRVPQPWIYERDCGCMRRVWNGIKEEEGEWGTKTRVHAPNARILVVAQCRGNRKSKEWIIIWGK